MITADSLLGLNFATLELTLSISFTYSLIIGWDKNVNWIELPFLALSNPNIANILDTSRV